MAAERRDPPWLSIAAFAAGAAIPADAPWLRDLVGWITGVVAQPDPALGRPGALCPFVPAALERDLLFVAIDSAASEPDVIASARAHAAVLLAREPAPPDPDAVYKSLLLAFPSVGDEDLVKRVRSRIKPELIARGLTCGEFYPSNDDRSVRNDARPIARSPVPLIAFRYLTPHDELFLRSQPELYAMFLRQMDAKP